MNLIILESNGIGAWMAARCGGVRRKAPGKAQRNLKCWEVKLSWGVIVREFHELGNNMELGLGWLRAVAPSGARPSAMSKII